MCFTARKTSSGVAVLGMSAPAGVLARIKPHTAWLALPAKAAGHAVALGGGVNEVNADEPLVMPDALSSQCGVHHPLLAPDPERYAACDGRSGRDAGEEEKIPGRVL